MMENGNAYELAAIADCASPDNLTSFGAMLLLGVQDSVNESVEYGDVDEDAALHIADDAPNIYTYQLWLEFVDLCAWQEDISEFGAITDMESGARTALYGIAYRLAGKLLAEAAEEEADEDATEKEG